MRFSRMTSPARIRCGFVLSQFYQDTIREWHGFTQDLLSLLILEIGRATDLLSARCVELSNGQNQVR